MDLSSLKYIIECIICHQVKRNGGIYHCLNGHNICSECKSNINVCPIERCRFSDDCRNTTAEKIRNNCHFKFKCKFTDQGCKECMEIDALKEHERICNYRIIFCSLNCGEQICANKFDQHVKECHVHCKYDKLGCVFQGKKRQIEKHEPECEFRIVECPVNKCKASLSQNEVISHVNTIHNGKEVIIGNDGGINTVWVLVSQSSKSISVPCRGKFDNSDFFFGFQEDIDGSFSAWIQVIGSETLAEKYKSCIMVQSPYFQIQSFNGKVFSIDCKNEDILIHKYCFNLSRKQVDQCLKTCHISGVENIGIPIYFQILTCD